MGEDVPFGCVGYLLYKVIVVLMSIYSEFCMRRCEQLVWSILGMCGFASC